MGLFSKKETCCICGNEEGKKKIASGSVCKDCLHSCSIPFQLKVNKETTKETILIEIENNKNNKNLIASFETTKKIGNYIEFDEHKRLWLIPDGIMGKKVNPKIYSFDEIVEYELLEDGDSITKGGLGGAIVGGVLLGGVGAIVGGVTGKKKTKSVINSLKIKITVNQTSKPCIYIDLIKSPTKADSLLYKAAYSSAQEILSMLSIINQNSKDTKQQQTTSNTVSVADELIKLKSLLDDGILTQEEFTIEKNKILAK